MEIPSFKTSVLQQRTGFYEQILDRIPALVYINTYTEPGNPQSLINEWSNRFANEFIGYSKEEVVAMGYSFFTTIMHPDDLEIIKTTFGAIVPQQPGSVFTFLHRLKPKNRDKFCWMYGNGLVVDVYPGGLPKTSLNVITEITNQMHTENQLVAALQEINRLRNELRCKSLSKREKEVLKNIVSGLTDREISEKLFISPATAKTHRNRIIKKLGFKNSASLAAFAAGCGFG
jgi:DNA-binding CsgD family transcriptional regulator